MSKFYAQATELDHICLRGTNRVIEATFVASSADRLFLSAFEPPTLFCCSFKASRVSLASLQHLNKTEAKTTIVLRLPATTSATPEMNRNAEFVDVSIPSFAIGTGADISHIPTSETFDVNTIGAMDIAKFSTSFKDKNFIGSATMQVTAVRDIPMRASSTPPPSPQALNRAAPATPRVDDTITYIDGIAPGQQDPFPKFTVRIKGSLQSLWKADAEPGAVLLFLGLGIFPSKQGSCMTAFEGTAIRAIATAASAPAECVVLPSLAFASACETSFTLRHVTVSGSAKSGFVVADGKTSLPIVAIGGGSIPLGTSDLTDIRFDPVNKVLTVKTTFVDQVRKDTASPPRGSKKLAPKK